MVKHYALGAMALMLATRMVAQPAFTEATASLGHNASSGGCMAVTDMDGDGLDDIVQLDMSTHAYVLYQNANGTFTMYDYGTISGSSQWGWAIADVDNNGHKDIIGGGAYDGTHYIRITSRGVYTLTDLDGPDIFTQCMSIGDMDNDGRLDVFACHDDGSPNIWFTNASGVPVNNNAYINWATACSGTSGDMSGNYGSTYTDFDNDGDLDFYISHCRQGVNDPNDCRRWNRLFVNDGTNHFTDQAATYGLDNHFQTWTSDFGDYDNDGDLDVVSTNHDNTMMLFQNDGTGHYTEVTAGSGLEVTGFFLQGLFRDFDNDGFLDVITSSAAFYFKGHGDGTFTQVNNLFPAAKTMHSFAIGDLNNDGFEDVYAGYGDGYVDGDNTFPDKLWLNTPNGNHWFNVQLRGVVSNRDAVGAKVIITGPWGTQVREIHAGESYGLVNSFTCHFGLGANDMVETMRIQWPSGLVENFSDLSADQTVTVKEGTCISPSAHITHNGPAVLCTGGPGLDLSADAGFSSYTWSTGANTQTINVTAGGTYAVTIDDGNGCPGHASIAVAQDPDQTPTVSTSTDPTICQGDEVTLTSTAADGYTWSTNAHDQSITVDQAGSYTVTIQGICQEWTSAPVVVDVLTTPGAPTSSDVTIPANTSADLTATGDSIVWYDSAVGGNVLATGSNYTTPTLTNTTSYWCADVLQHGGEVTNGGKTDRNSSVGAYHNNNSFYLLFDAYDDFVLKSVKVYANGAASRTIALVDQSNNTTITSGTFDVPDGESRIQLNWNVTAGGPYGLRVSSANPQLWRDGSGSNPTYPYALGTLGAITTTSVSGSTANNYYYFFYDWEVAAMSTYCTGPRTEVVVHVGPTGIDENAATALRVYPNPTNGDLNIAFGNITGAVDLNLVDITGRTVIARHINAANGLATLDLSGLATGEYGLRIRSNTGTEVRRVVVH